MLDGITYLNVEELEKFIKNLKVELSTETLLADRLIGDVQYHERKVKELAELLRIAENELFDKVMLNGQT